MSPTIDYALELLAEMRKVLDECEEAKLGPIAPQTFDWIYGTICEW